jgi:hypothetical protein
MAFYRRSGLQTPQFKVCPHDKLGKHCITQIFTGNYLF